MFVVVDCNFAELATILDHCDYPHTGGRYVKEVIAAASTGNGTYDKLTPALCTVLPKWNLRYDTKSATRLHRLLATEVQRLRAETGNKKTKRLTVLKKKKAGVSKAIKKHQKKHERLAEKLKEVVETTKKQENEKDTLEKRIATVKKQRGKILRPHAKPHFRESCQ